MYVPLAVTASGASTQKASDDSMALICLFATAGDSLQDAQRRARIRSIDAYIAFRQFPIQGPNDKPEDIVRIEKIVTGRPSREVSALTIRVQRIVRNGTEFAALRLNQPQQIMEP